MKPKTTWVLVADGATAKVFNYLGRSAGLEAIEGLMFEQDHLKARDINSDRDRGTYSGSAARGQGQGGYEPPNDAVQVREARFVKNVAAALEERFRRKEFDKLVIAAAPTALGDLRPQLSKELQGAIIAEVPKDLTKSPTPKLEEQLQSVLAPNAV
jgi:protein required for attachment to host cells